MSKTMWDCYTTKEKIACRISWLLIELDIQTDFMFKPINWLARLLSDYDSKGFDRYMSQLRKRNGG